MRDDETEGVQPGHTDERVSQYGAALPALDVKLTDEQAARLDAAVAAAA